MNLNLILHSGDELEFALQLESSHNRLKGIESIVLNFLQNPEVLDHKDFEVLIGSKFENALKIYSDYRQKYDQVGLFAKIICFGIDDKIEKVYRNIQQLIYPPRLPFNLDGKQEILNLTKYLNIKEISILMQINREALKLGKYALLERSKQYGYLLDDFEGSIKYYKLVRNQLNKIRATILPNQFLMMPIDRNIEAFQKLSLNHFLKIFANEQAFCTASKIIRFFYQFKAKFKSRVYTFKEMNLVSDSLRNTVKLKSKGVFKFLIDSGIDPNQLIHNQSPVLHLAVEERDLPMIKLILKSGAMINQRNHKGETALLIASGLNEKNECYTEIASFLLEKGADPNIKDYQERTPLYCATMNQENSLVKYLLKSGAKINEKFEYGSTALMVATCMGFQNKRPSPSLVHLLLKNGANPNLRNDFQLTALSSAASRQCEKSIKLLIEYGADVNAKGNDGLTPLFRALIGCVGHRYNSGAIELLLENGADPEVADDFGDKPFDWFYKNYKEEINRGISGCGSSLDNYPEVDKIIRRYK